MRRLAIVGVFLGVAFLIARGRMSRVHERLMAGCEGMFERMPDTFPPKRAMGGIEEIRGTTKQILELLADREEKAPETRDASSTAAHHAA